MMEWFSPAASGARGKPAVFLDRDGVLNERFFGSYVLRAEDFRWLPGAIENVRRLCRDGREIVIVTNQSCINRGLLDAAVLAAIMSDVVGTLERNGARCLGWLCCPHAPSERCACRKPEPEMLARAAEMTGIDMTTSVLVGDSPSDIGAAKAAGIQGILIESNLPQEFTRAVDRIIGLGP